MVITKLGGLKDEKIICGPILLPTRKHIREYDLLSFLCEFYSEHIYREGIGIDLFYESLKDKPASLKLAKMIMEDRFIDEKTKIEYVRVGDYYIPNLTLPKPRRTGNIGKYGRLKLNYMKKYKIPEYTEMLLNNELNSYLLDIEDACKNKIEILIKQMAKKENITEELKANNQLEWVGRMNNIKHCAEELILKELIYV